MKINAIHIHNKACSTALMMLCCMVFFSCVEVDLCEESSHDHLSSVKLNYIWPDSIAESERPGSMFAFINHMTSKHRIGYITDSVGGRYRYRYGKVYSDTSAYAPQPLKVRAGEYQIFAFNKDVVENEAYYQLENLNNFFSESSETSIRDLRISYTPHNISGDWIDFNPKFKYIATNIEPIYFAKNKYDKATQSYTFIVPKDGKAEVDLDLRKVTQDITFSFPIYTEFVDSLSPDSQLHIDSIIAEISGIPHGISIYDDLVEVDTTTIYKMLFKMDVDTVNFDIVDSTTMKFPTDFKVEKLKKMECKSTISVMGLLANKNPNYINGAGILQVRIYSHIGNKYKKIQYAKINLYKMIKKAHLIITDDWNRIILNSGTNPDFPLSNTFCIDENVLVITRDLTLNTLNNNGSLDTWEGDENNDGEVDDDHLFPDIEM